MLLAAVDGALMHASERVPASVPTSSAALMHEVPTKKLSAGNTTIDYE